MALPIPEEEVFENPNNTSYFTEEGIRFFGKAIEVLMNYINGYDKGQYIVNEIEIILDLREDQVLYSDDFQKIIAS